MLTFVYSKAGITSLGTDCYRRRRENDESLVEEGSVRYFRLRKKRASKTRSYTDAVTCDESATLGTVQV